MGEIAQILQSKVGLSDEQAQSAENVILEYIQAKVPPQFQGIVSSVLGTPGGAPADGAAPAASGGLGGLLDEAESLFNKR